MLVPSSDNGDGTFTNPVLRADFPDPDIIRVGRDYYMVSSTFHCMPGIPVLHSRDLVNWKIIGHAYDSLTFLPAYSMEEMSSAYGLCCWAPTIKYSDGWFYIGTNIAGQRFILCRSRKPEGPYEMTVFDCQFYDPGLFIDDDGRKYVVHGRDKVRVTELNNEMTAPLGDAKGTLILDSKKIGGLEHMRVAGLEGSHVYKRNGWYYVFNTAKGYEGVQMVSRARNVFGPYETRKLVDSDLNYVGAGLHQGGYVDTPSGSCVGYLFQDRDYVGRCPVMFPINWVDDWPVCRSVPVVGDKPDAGINASLRNFVLVRSPQESDDFSGKTLKAVWEWNHVPVSERYSLAERRGFLRLYAMPSPGFKWARNSLTQRFTGPSSCATALLCTRGLRRGDFAGNGIMGSTMLQQGVLRTADGSILLQVRQSVEDKDTVLESTPLPSAERVWLRTEVTKRGTVNFSWSLDGRTFQPIGSETKSGFFGYLGVRHALSCYSQPAEGVGKEFFTRSNLLAARTGYADFDCFVIDETIGGNHYDASRPVDFDLYDDAEGLRLLRPASREPRQLAALEQDSVRLAFHHIRVPRRTSRMAIRLLAQQPGTKIEVYSNKKRVGNYVLSECDVADCRHPGLPLRAFPMQWKEVCFPVSVPSGTHHITFRIVGSARNLLLRDFQFEP